MLVRISHGLCVKVALTPLTLIIQTEERLIVSPGEYTKSRRTQDSVLVGAADADLGDLGSARPADSQVYLCSKHFC